MCFQRPRALDSLATLRDIAVDWFLKLGKDFTT